MVLAGIHSAREEKHGYIGRANITSIDGTLCTDIHEMHLIPTFSKFVPRNMSWLSGPMKVPIVSPVASKRPFEPYRKADILLGLNHAVVWLWEKVKWWNTRFLAVKTPLGWVATEISDNTTPTIGLSTCEFHRPTGRRRGRVFIPDIASSDGEFSSSDTDSEDEARLARERILDRLRAPLGSTESIPGSPKRKRAEVSDSLSLEGIKRIALLAFEDTLERTKPRSLLPPYSPSKIPTFYAHYANFDDEYAILASESQLDFVDSIGNLEPFDDSRVEMELSQNSSLSYFASKEDPDSDSILDSDPQVLAINKEENPSKSCQKDSLSRQEKRELIDIFSQLNKLLERYWDGESFPGENTGHTVEEDRCIQRMNKSFEIINGKCYIDPLWKEGQPEVGLRNFHFAKERLKGVHRKLTDVTYKCLDDIFKDYVAKDLIEEVKVDDPYAEDALYWAMFPVMQPNSETTPVRPVMDGAAKCLNGKSINEVCFSKGPNLLNDLTLVLLRFRRYKFGFMADISKMFLKVRNHKHYRKYYRFLWCDRSGENLIYYQFKGHLFGNNGSPTVAIFATQRNAQDFAEKYPLAVETIIQSTIMDDHTDSAPTEDGVYDIVTQIAEMHARIGLSIGKFASNSLEASKRLPSSISKSEGMIGLEKFTSDTEYAPGTEPKAPQVKTLGQQWDMANDVMTYNVNKTVDKKWTKAACLSQAHRIFDPLGGCLPIILGARLFMQKLWKQEHTWTSPITSEEEEEWLLWTKNLEELNKLKFQRVLIPKLPEDIKNIQIHVFCDASKEAYAAVSYIRVSYKDGTYYTNFIMAKSHVTPYKLNRTIPKLELMALELGNRLANHVVKSIVVPKENIFLWTDSKTAIQWLNMDPNHLQVLAHNYCKKIRNDRELSHIKWVSTDLNSADLATRPKTVGDLLEKQDLWFTGPPFLKMDEKRWPSLPELSKSMDVLQEVKKEYKLFANHNQVLALQPNEFEFESGPDCLISEFSSYDKLSRIFAYVAKFIDKCRGVSKRRSLILTSTDMARSEELLVRMHQKDYFSDEVDSIRKNILSVTNPLYKVGAELHDGILRICGRIRKAPYLNERARSPYLLHPDGHLTILLVRHYHGQILKHTGGIRCLLGEMHQHYWISGNITSIKRHLDSCVICRRNFPKVVMPKMSLLPDTRIPTDKITVPFTSVVIDAAGPWYTTFGRGRAKQKRWILLIRCTVYGIIHLEVLHDMSEQAFLMAFSRFTNRRIVPQIVYCDNGTNFVGGSNQIERIWQKVQLKKPLIRFIFGPGDSAHFQGSIERIVQAVKIALKTVLRDDIATLTDDTFNTSLTEVERYLNNRPIAYKDKIHESKDPEVITPNHFLLSGRIGETITTLLPDDYNTLPSNLSQIRRIKELLVQFHRRFQKEITPYLRRYHKWATGRDTLALNDIVVIIPNENINQDKYKVGRIIKVTPGTDDINRRFTVQVGQSIYERAANKLSLLLPYDHEVKKQDPYLDSSNSECEGPITRAKAKAQTHFLLSLPKP